MSEVPSNDPVSIIELYRNPAIHLAHESNGKLKIIIESYRVFEAI